MVFGPSRRVARRTSRRTSRRQMAMYGGQQQQQQEYYDDEPEPQYQAPPPQPAQQDYAAELQKLAQLRDSGVLTDEEFEAKKKQILGI
jgi:hypothetical protein